MIYFGCKNCGKVFQRPESASGSLLFCECGASNQVPWESTASAPPPLAAPLPAYPPPISRPIAYSAPVYRERNPAYCLNHSQAASTQTCTECNERFCNDCVTSLQGKTLCGPCKNYRLRNLQRPPQLSVTAILAPIIAFVGAPFSLLVLAGSGAEAAPSVVMTLMLFGLAPQLVALILGAYALSHTEINSKLGGRSLAITGIVASMVCGIILCEFTVLALHITH